MPPKLLSDHGCNVAIRPLAYCLEADPQALSDLRQYPIVPCNLCGSQEGLKRQVVKEMLQSWENEHPGRSETIFKAIKNVAPSQLADSELFNFEGLARTFHSGCAEEPITNLAINVRDT